MRNKNNQSENRKALPKFLIYLFLCLLLGGVIGYFSGRYSLFELGPVLKSGARGIAVYAGPILLVLTAILLPCYCLPVYKKAKAQLEAWDGEDEEVYEAADKKLSALLQVLSYASIVIFVLVAAAYSGGVSVFEDPVLTVLFFVGLVAFIAVLAETIILQQKIVDIVKKYNPEKHGSVYDLKFQEKWMDGCDEAEKMMVGQCATKAFTATSAACSLLAGVLAICALIFDTGFLPSLAVCAIWFISQRAYYRESLKFSQHKE